MNTHVSSIPSIISLAESQFAPGMFRVDAVEDEFTRRPGSVFQFYVEEALKKYEICIRCQRKIYPTETADLGVPLHKNCFRCAECNVTLTINSYIIARPDNAECKAVYCKSHAPKPVMFAMDDQALEIKNAVKAQRINKRPSFNKLVSNKYSICNILCYH